MITLKEASVVEAITGLKGVLLQPNEFISLGIPLSDAPKVQESSYKPGVAHDGIRIAIEEPNRIDTPSSFDEPTQAEEEEEPTTPPPFDELAQTEEDVETSRIATPSPFPWEEEEVSLY